VTSTRFCLIPESSHNDTAVFGEYNIKPNSFDVILHELFGYARVASLSNLFTSCVASAEGCAIAMHHAIQQYRKPGGISIPSKAATFFTLTEINSKVFLFLLCNYFVLIL
jgi:hypothetical protein